MKELLPLTNQQKNIWDTELFYSGTSINNVGGYIFIEQKVNFDVLQKALNIYIKHTDSIRLQFTEKDDEVKQYVSDYAEQKFNIINVKNIEEIKKLNVENLNESMNVYDSDLFNIKFFKLPNEKGGLVFSFHHLINDAWGISLFISRVIDIYSSLLKEKGEFEDYPKYTEYVINSVKYKDTKRYTDDKKYWEDTFEKEPVLTYIYKEKTKNLLPEDNIKGTREICSIDNDLSDKITTFCKENNVSMYIFFMAIYLLYLAKINDTDSATIGTPVLNRSNFSEKQIAGMFVSDVPFKVDIDSNLTFKEFLKNVELQQKNIYRHQKYSYIELLEYIRKKHNISENLYDFVLSYQNAKDNKNSTDVEFSTEWANNKYVGSSIEAHFYDMDDSGKASVFYNYQTHKFTKEDIKNLHARIINMARIALNDVVIKDIPVITDEEKKIIDKFNDTDYKYDKKETIVEIFEKQVEKNRNKVAVISKDKTITYGELDKRSNKLANYLLSKGVTKQDVIGIMFNRTFDIHIAMLAVLKTGASYLLIDPTLPKDRINYMLENSKVPFVITNLYLNYETIGINESEKSSDKLPNIKSDNEDRFCVIYTSGSTGVPKGVEVRRLSVINVINSYIKVLNASKCDMFLSSVTVAFDMFIVENFTAFFTGKTIVIADEEEQKIPAFTSKLIEKYKIDFMLATPSKISLLFDEGESLKNLKVIQLGGEVIKPTLIRELRKWTNADIHDGYGPSECCACSTNKKIVDENDISIGTPLLNIKVYIMNKDNNILPVNVPGELVITGDGVGIGYVGKNKFNGVYRTGDIAKLKPNMEIDYIGRRDNQIKLHGLRIELEEITEKIMSIKGITNAISVIKKVNNADKICSYVITDRKFEEGDIKKELITKLPNYMVPDHIIFMEKFPVTLNGKIDTKKLPEVIIQATEFVESSTDTEKELEKIWKKILKLDKISVKSNFFDIGGDSLASIRVVSEVYSKLNKKISIKDIFEMPTIYELAKCIDSKKTEENQSDYDDEIDVESNETDEKNNKINARNNKIYVENNKIKARNNETDVESNEINGKNKDKENITVRGKLSKKVKISSDELYPVTSMQRGIYYTVNISEDNLSYNTPFGIVFDKIPDVKKLEQALNTIINFNQAFRTYFVTENNDIYQKVCDKIDFKLKVVDYKNEEFVKPFELDKAPLIHAELDKFDGNAILLLDIHHIICDGASISEFINELCKLYNGEDLEEKKLDYIDYSLIDKINEDDKNYWISQFKDGVPLLNLPTEFDRTNTISDEGNSIFDNLSNSNEINEFCKKHSITPYMFLLSCYYCLLYKYTMQNDIVVGTPVIGRDDERFSKVIGMFINTLALRQNIEGAMNFNDFLSIVRENCINSFAHQKYPFDELVKNVELVRDNSRRPIFDVLFVYESGGNPKLNFNNINTEYYVLENKTAKFDITLEVTPDQDKYNIRLEYVTKLFSKRFIQTFLNCYKNIINAVLQEPNIQISKINMMPDVPEVYPKLDIDENVSVIELFERQVAKTPNKVALIFEGKKYTYKELEEKVNRLANHIRKMPIYKNEISKDKYKAIGIMMNRRAELIISMLAILKVGAGYLPIDPTYPEDRIRYIISDSGVKLLLTEEKIKTNYGVKRINVDDDSVYDNYEKFDIDISSDDVSYVIYTSGSTGRPKGVLLKQLGVVNFIQSIPEIIPIKEKTIVSITTMCFDIFVFESLVPVCSGMTIVLANNEEQNNPLLLNKLCLENKVQILQTTPSKFRFLMTDNLEYIKKLEIISILGEPFPMELLKKIKEVTDAKIFNGYGPTETTVASTFKELTNTKSKITIGTPVPNTCVYVLDNDLNQVPVGVPGKLFIGGLGVSIGYINKPEMTAERYIEYKGQRVYDTGDLVKLLPNGELECLGRVDFQVKVRGLRIELLEIESIICAYKGVQDAVVCVKNLNGRDILCGYFTATGRISISLLKDSIAKKLPNYMVPTYLIQIKNFTYTPNGKIDRKVLPEPKVEEKTIIAPKTPLQKKLAKMWSSILSIEKISIDDNFFDIGGDSLCALKLQLELMKAGYDVNYGEIFKYNTISSLAQFIENKDTDTLKIYEKKDFKKINKVLKCNSAHRKIKLKKRELKNVLLIGATGFLGIHCLAELLKIDDIKIYCLIREDISTSSENKLKNKFKYYFDSDLSNLFGTRIFVINGDITEEKFGLSGDIYNFVGNNVSYVLNCAALVKHYGEYSEFEKINVYGVRNIIEFCETYNKEFFQTSTVSVSGNTVTNLALSYNPSKKVYFGENNLFINQSFDNVYVRSKFEAEKIILEEMEKKQLNALIMRIGNITNRYTDGKFQENGEENAFSNRLKAFIAIGMMPQSIMNNEIEFTPVDKVAEAIVRCMEYGNRSYSVVHLYNSKHLFINDLYKMLCKLNINVKIEENDIFKKKLKKWLYDNVKSDKVNVLLNDLDKESNLVYKTNLYTTNKFTLKLLNKIGFDWPEIDIEYIKKILKNLS